MRCNYYIHVTNLGHICYSIGIIHQFTLVHFNLPKTITSKIYIIELCKEALKIYARISTLLHLRVYGKEKFSLMRSNATGVNTFHQSCVFVDKPRFSQHICRCIFKLKPYNIQDYAKISIFLKKHKVESRFISRR